MGGVCGGGGVFNPPPSPLVHLARELQSARLVVFEVSRPAVFNPSTHISPPRQLLHYYLSTRSIFQRRTIFFTIAAACVCVRVSVCWFVSLYDVCQSAK